MSETFQILEISEREQRRIGQDLHDSLGQILTGIAFISKLLEQKLAEKSLAEADHAAEITKLVRDAIHQTHSLVSTLNPLRLDSEGLVLALDELAQSTKKIFRISCQLKCHKPLQINNVTARHLYRIVQEAINNAVRHGKANNILISLHALNHTIILSVKDDGSGFPKAVNNNGGMGLRIMKYRAQTIGAKLNIQNNPDGGTMIICMLKQNHKKIIEGGTDGRARRSESKEKKDPHRGRPSDCSFRIDTTDQSG